MDGIETLIGTTRALLVTTAAQCLANGPSYKDVADRAAAIRPDQDGDELAHFADAVGRLLLEMDLLALSGPAEWRAASAALEEWRDGAVRKATYAALVDAMRRSDPSAMVNADPDWLVVDGYFAVDDLVTAVVAAVREHDARGRTRSGS